MMPANLMTCHHQKYNRLITPPTRRRRPASKTSPSSNTSNVSHATVGSAEVKEGSPREEKVPCKSSRMGGGRVLRRLVRWPLVHLCLPLCLVLALACLCHAHQVGGQMGAPGAGEMKKFKSHRVGRRSPPWATEAGVEQRARSLLVPINELRVAGSKLEPPSRPSVDWSKQRPYFGPNTERNVSVELGKTAHLTCKVFELGDKTVSWLRPRENEILTVGKYTYIGDSRISSMNEPGSNDWILEIKDVSLNDSTSYECQVSTDPKLSLVINLHVQAARARIKQGENNYYPPGANVEFVCEILHPSGRTAHRSSAYPTPVGAHNQIYWYHNGNLINYARTGVAEPTNFSIDFDPASQTSRLKLSAIQQGDSGNYTCRPTAAEPATVRLFVKKHRSKLSNHAPNLKESQRGRQLQQQQQHGLELPNSLDLIDSANQVHSLANTRLSPTPQYVVILMSCILFCLL